MRETCHCPKNETNICRLRCGSHISEKGMLLWQERREDVTHISGGLCGHSLATMQYIALISQPHFQHSALGRSHLAKCTESIKKNVIVGASRAMCIDDNRCEKSMNIRFWLILLMANRLKLS